MMKKILSSFFIVFIFAALAGSFFLPKDDILQDERRKRTPFPSWEDKKGRQYFAEIDKFATDNFPYRHYFFQGYRLAVNAVGSQIDMQRAYRGRDGWLFIGNVGIMALDKLEGRMVPDPENSNLVKKVHYLAYAFEEKGIKVVFVLAPRKDSIYPEKLPAIIKPAPHRYVLPYLDWLRANGVDVIDPTAALIERKKTDILYRKHDTHWNYVGASVAFEAVAKHFGLDNCPVAYQFKPVPNYADELTRIGFFDKSPVDLEDYFVPQWSPPSQVSEHIVSNPNIPPDSQTRITNNPQPSQKEAMWIIGDSYRSAIIPFLSNCFSSSYNFHIHHTDRNEILNTYENIRSKPSYLVIIVSERYF